MNYEPPFPPLEKSAIRRALAVAALGYFVDMYDLILFSILRVKSLVALGVPATALLDQGVLLLNMQMAGMLLGGVLWGVLGDKRGRLSVLYGSIIAYSLANIANGFVDDVPTYAALRFIAGIGLAGELGAGVTLVSESMDRDSRGWGPTIISTIGVMGAMTAGFVGGLLDWRTSYIVGGILGLLLLGIRVGVRESPMFALVRSTRTKRGSLRLLLGNSRSVGRYIRIILVGLPIWYTAAILITFCPEFGTSFGMPISPNPASAVMYYYMGLTLGDFLSGWLSQVYRSRKQVLFAFIFSTSVTVGLYFTVAAHSLGVFYGVCGFIGVACGYWAVFVTVAAELYGTNLRSTVTTTVPNFVRGSVVPITMAFQYLKEPLGLERSALGVGLCVLSLALWGLSGLEETWGRDLDFVETGEDVL